ncbi:MAG TPA: hypothetical protein EYG68_02410 [Leucothrix mucor]|nr:hypothetical protein [Leucothrix mucor]
MNDKLHPDFELLLAYVDGQLNETEHRKAEALILRDQTAQDFVQELQKSQLPYRDAFQPLLEAKKITSKEVLVAPKSNRWAWSGAIAASLCVGLIAGGLFISNQQINHDDWVMQVADYQLLYVRDTLNTPNPEIAQVAALSEKLGKQLGTKLIIPDLSSHALSFKRGQVLETHGKPLIQLAYLPKQGRPVALCITAIHEDDSPQESGTSRGLSFVKWTKNGLGYVLIGDVKQEKLQQMANHAVEQMG